MNETPNVWPHVAISIAVVAFCAFLVWRVPTQITLAIGMVTAVLGWWLPSPGQSGSGSLVTSLVSSAIKPELRTTQQEGK